MQSAGLDGSWRHDASDADHRVQARGCAGFRSESGPSGTTFELRRVVETRPPFGSVSEFASLFGCGHWWMNSSVRNGSSRASAYPYSLSRFRAAIEGTKKYSPAVTRTSSCITVNWCAPEG